MKKRHITHGLCMLSVILSAALASPARAATVDVSVEGTVTKPTCSVTTSHKTVTFGAVAPGEKKELFPITVGVNCAGANVTTSVWASLKVGGYGSFPHMAYMVVDGVIPTDGMEKTVFQLKNTVDDLPINFFENTFQGFCAGITDRTCTLKPFINVNAKAKTGTGKIVVVFNLNHS